MSALIVTAGLGAADFAWLDGERRAHFPPDRNRLAAHVTLFHALPPSAEAELRRLLATLAGGPPPRAEIPGLINLGRGVAYRVASPALAALRDRIAERFHGSLTAQDAGGWRAHVTIQNKVEPSEARALLASKEQGFRPRPLAIRSLELHRYRDGDWQPLGDWPFRGA